MDELVFFVSEKAALVLENQTWRESLVQHISRLILTDIDALYQLLYRVDVEENQIRLALENEETDAAEMLTELIIARCVKTLETRKRFARNKSHKKHPNSEQEWIDVD